MNAHPQKTKLPEALEHTATWAWIEGDGSLVIEHYDFSPEAEGYLGGEVAYQLRVPSQEQERMLRYLMDVRIPSGRHDHAALLLEWIARKFSGYYDIQRWLQENGIPFEKKIENQP